MADELDDDFLQSDVESQEEIDLEENEENIPTQPSSLKKKRKLESKDEGGRSEEEKLKKKKQKLKKQKKAAANLALEEGVLATFPVEMQTDHLRKLMKSCKEFQKLSELELDQVGIQQSMLIDRMGWKVDATKQGSLIELIEKAMPKVRKLVEDQIQEGTKGQPLILVITGNAQRAADLSKLLRNLLDQKSSGKQKIAVGKLFARHFKVEEQKQFLQSHICPLAVGTPQRLQDLLTQGLSLESVQCIILDVSWTDQKKRTMLDTIEIRQSLFSMFASNPFQERLRGTGGKKKGEKIGKEKAKILLY